MFSVIIPLFNKADFITKTIHSVLNQSYTAFELIVVDDGSNDDGMLKVESITDPRLKIIRQKNSGVSVARNRGAAMAKYEYIAFLDADDWWEKDFLYEIKLLIENCPDAVLLGSNYYINKYGKKKKAVIGVSPDFEANYIDYFKTYSNTFWMPFTSSSVAISKKIFLEMEGFKHSLTMGEDFDLWVRIALKYKVAFVNKYLSIYNQDVPVNGRAIGGEKVWKKSEHMIFNLGYLYQEEINKPYLKKLLDGLRVRSLLRYYLSNTYKEEVHELLTQVNFNRQSLAYNLYYKMPKSLVTSYFKFRRFGSQVKKYFLSYQN